MRVLVAVVVVLGVGCGPPSSGGEDAGPDAMPTVCESDAARDYCEVINSPPPECFGDPCPCDGMQRACDSERVCKTWDDCDGCYQCRYRYYCLCR